MDYLVFGFIGGVVPDALRVIEHRHEPALPQHFRSLNFYMGLILLVALGGLMVYLRNPKDAVEALAIGYAAPQLLSTAAGGLLKKSGDQHESVARGGFVDFMRRWW